MNKVNFNGQISPSSSPIFQVSNRAFNYGDGLFETMRISEGKILFLSKHWERLNKSMKMLHLHWPNDFTIEDFKQECLKIYPQKGDFRVRFTAWRAGTGLYTPNSQETHFLVSGNPLDSAPYPFNSQGLSLHRFTEKAIHPDRYSWIKSTNALIYVLAGIAKQASDWEDCLILNTQGRIAEASSSNIFLIKGKSLISPPLSEGGIAGIVRGVLLEEASHAGFLVEEKSIDETALLAADEVFLSNSIAGIKWVGQYKNSTFGQEKSRQLHSLLSKTAKKST